MASEIFYVDIDGSKVNSLINWRHNPLTTAQRLALIPSLGPVNVGFFVFDTDLLQGFYWSGSVFIPQASGTVFSGAYSDLTGKPTFDNGLTDTANVIQLGGNLIQNTIIPLSGFSFEFDSTAGGTFFLKDEVDGTLHFITDSGTDGDGNDSALSLLPTGVFHTISGPSGATLVYMQPQGILFDTAQVEIVGQLQIVDGSQGTPGDVFTAIDAVGHGAWRTPGSPSGVTSVFGREGNVIAQIGDYNTSQVTENTNLYFTNARAIGSLLTGYISSPGTISAADSILSAIEKLNGNITNLESSGVTSFDGRKGAVILLSSDVTGALGFIPQPAGIYITGANDGLSVSGGTIVQLGQSVGKVGNPAILLQNTEIPSGGFNLSLSGAGHLIIGSNVDNGNTLQVSGNTSLFHLSGTTATPHVVASTNVTLVSNVGTDLGGQINLVNTATVAASAPVCVVTFAIPYLTPPYIILTGWLTTGVVGPRFWDVQNVTVNGFTIICGALMAFAGTATNFSINYFVVS